MQKVPVPLNLDTVTPDDHFPEHRHQPPWGLAFGYLDGQIGSTGLWETRKGMRSKCLPSGTIQYGVRFQRALRNTGFVFSDFVGGSDLELYLSFKELEASLLEEWATSGSPGGPPAFAHNGPHTTSKVTSGFAKIGIFLIPSQCIDGDPATHDPCCCPDIDAAGDAVIAIEDNDPTDAIIVHGVEHEEVDYLKRDGLAPTFHVWTGPRYRFAANGNAAITNPCPCNTKFRVDVSTNESFTDPVSLSSPWVVVDANPVTIETPECHGTWTPSASEWDSLRPADRLYYRTVTRDAADGNERISTEPGKLRTVPPPYAVINATGRSNF